MMNVIDTAMAIEQEGYQQYVSLAEKTPVREIKGIFTFLANEELRHLSYFKSLSSGETLSPVERSGLAEYAKKVLGTLSEQFASEGIPAINYDDAYTKALELEAKSIVFYSNALNKPELKDTQEEQLLQEIVAQEKIHARVLSSLLELLRHSGEWLENAEWPHLTEY